MRNRHYFCKAGNTPERNQSGKGEMKVTSIVIERVVAVMLLILANACTNEKTIHVLPDGTEVAPTETQEVDEGSQTVSHQPREVTAQPAPLPTAAVTSRREDRLIRLVTEKRPPTGFAPKVPFVPKVGILCQ